MIPIYPNGLAEEHTLTLLNQLSNRIDYLEERDFYNEELIQVLVKHLRILEAGHTHHANLIADLQARTTRVEPKQNIIRVRFGEHVSSHIRIIKKMYARIGDIEQEIDNLNT